MKLKIKYLMTLVLFVLFSFSLVAANGGKILLAYYPDWVGGYRAANLPYDKVTHIAHAFIIPEADGTFSYGGSYLEPDMIATAHSKGVKVITSIGGANEKANENFKKVAASPVLRKTFTKNLVKFIKENGYDGADFDWEFPNTEADKYNFPLLIKETREAFTAETGTGTPWLITAAVGGTNWSQQWLEYPMFIQYMDYVNLMAYDMHGAWNDHAGHNAALKKGDDSCTEVNDETYIDYMTQTKKIPAEKLVLGVPFYGHEFPNAEALYVKMTNTPEDIFMNYNQLAPLIDNGWSRHWDDGAQVPYLAKDSVDSKWNPIERVIGFFSGMQTGKQAGILTYDDEKSIALKVKYAIVERKLAGVFMWDVTADNMDGKTPLMDAMYKAYEEACAEVKNK
ncbi:MAG: glycoside hydrolase family 18 protein [bacterium]